MCTGHLNREVRSELAMNIRKYFSNCNRYLETRATPCSYCVGIPVNLPKIADSAIINNRMVICWSVSHLYTFACVGKVLLGIVVHHLDIFFYDYIQNNI